MPSNLIDGPGQFQLGSLLLGKAPYRLASSDGDVISGLFDLEAKSQDFQLDHADGSYLGPDFVAGGMVSIRVLVESTSAVTRAGMAAQVLSSVVSLRSAWAPQLADVELFGKLEGVGLFKVWGKPRGVQSDVSRAHSGGAPCQLFFQTRDGTITFI